MSAEIAQKNKSGYIIYQKFNLENEDFEVGKSLHIIFWQASLRLTNILKITELILGGQ